MRQTGLACKWASSVPFFLFPCLENIKNALEFLFHNYNVTVISYNMFTE